LALSYKDWFTIRRLIPIALAVGALVAMLLEVTDRLSPQAFERVVILLLGLLGLDALVERIALLEKIYGYLREHRQKLNDRSAVQTTDIFVGARDITLSGVTLLNVLQDREHLFQTLLSQGALLRVLMLNPESAAWSVWDNATDGAPNAAHLAAALAVLRKLHKRLPEARLEVRYAPYLLPTCLVIVDPALPRGRLIAELVFTDTLPYERPHLALSRLEDPHWFDFFRDRLEALWNSSSPVDLRVDTSLT
jgi:hypothetical protein